MKTNTITPTLVQFQSTGERTPGIRLRNSVRVLLALFCVSLVSFTSAPDASAAAPNGEYQFVSATGSLTAGGETQELPQELLQEIAALKNGRIVIENSRMQLNRKAMVKMINQLEEQLGVEIETTITGPSTLTLHPSGKAYVGSTSRPIVVSFETTIEGKRIYGNLKTSFKAKVKGRTMTLTVPVSGSLIGKKFTGDVTITCKRTSA